MQIYPGGYREKVCYMKSLMGKLERLLEWGGIKKDITLLVISGIAVLGSLLKLHPFLFDLTWVAIILCGVPIILMSTGQVPNFCSERESPEDMRAFSKERAESCGDSPPERTWRSHGPQSPATLQ